MVHALQLMSPVAYLAGFTVALHGLIDTGRLSYAQYLVPAVVVQSVVFVALVTADRSARDHLSGLGERLGTLPIATAVPVSARMVATLIRAVLALSVAMIAGYAFGFRMTGGPGYALAFVLIALLLCLAVGLGADALGSSTKSVQGASQLLVVPQLLLFMLSTGIAPEKTFPGWLRPYVRNQPVSQVAEHCAAWPAGMWRSATWRPAWLGVSAWRWSSARSPCGCRGETSDATGRDTKLAADPELGASRSTPHPVAA